MAGDADTEAEKAEDAVDAEMLLDSVAPRLAAGERLAGGSVSDVRRVRWPKGDVVVKVAPAAASAMLAAEADGLRAIERNGRVPVATVLAAGVRDGRALLVLGHLPPAAPTGAAWARFGRSLAAMHAEPIDQSVRSAAGDRASGGDDDGGVGGFGWPRPTWLGTTPQPAAWEADWPQLLVGRRLRPLLRMGRDAGRFAAGEQSVLERTLARLERDLPRRPRPSLVHGDLWSGNALATVDPAAGPGPGCRIALIDPAITVGDAWWEIGLMELFGGFPAECRRAYDEAAGGQPPDASLRIAVGRLHHLLNHLVLFGEAYRGAVMQEAAAIQRA